MATELETARDEARRCVYMLAFKANDLDREKSHELCGTVANALLHHHPDLLDDVELEMVRCWALGSPENLSAEFWVDIAGKL